MTEFFLPSGSSALSAASVQPEQAPKAVLVIIHGMAEHKKRYYPFMNWLAEMGIASVIPDLHGHGASVKSADDLGYFGKQGYKVLLDDVKSCVEWARNNFPGRPVFLLGHSMGSLVVRCFIRENDSVIDGLVVCGSPSSNPAAGPGAFLARCIILFKGKRYRSPLLTGLTTDPYNKSFKAEGLTNAWLSVNKANVYAYNNDPLCGFPFTANGYLALFKLLKLTYSPKGWVMAHPELPVHFIAGANDPCIGNTHKFSRAVSFLRKRGYKQVTSKLYQGMRHEILNETGREEVWRDVLDVLKSWL